MTKADLFKTEPKVIGEELFVALQFSKTAKWAPKSLLTEDIPIKEYLLFLEHTLGQIGESGWSYKSDTINVETTKTTAKLMYKEYYFPLKLKDLYSLAKAEAEHLFLEGYLSLD